MHTTQKYMTIEIDNDTIYIIEEVYGVEIDRVRLNRITRATFIQFHQFFETRYRSIPVVVKNDKKNLSIVKELLPAGGPIKGMIQKLTDDYILLDMSTNIDSANMKLTKEKKILPNIRVLFENV